MSGDGDLDGGRGCGPGDAAGPGKGLTMGGGEGGMLGMKSANKFLALWNGGSTNADCSDGIGGLA